MILAIATFAGDTVNRLYPEYCADPVRDESVYERLWREDNRHSVVGTPQEVMFFIGYAAGQGEDSLIGYVTRVEI